MDRGPHRFRRRFLPPSLLGALALGCSTAGETLEFGLNPFASTDVQVVATEPHGPYLFTQVKGPQLDLRFIVPRTAACGRLLEPGASLRYEKAGIFGSFAGGGVGCDAIGTLSLAAWRDRQPRRGGGASPVPRSTALYGVDYRDAQYLMLRGRFLLATRVGVPRPQDVVAVVPNDETCSALASSAQASLEFRPAGPNAFVLLTGNAPCPVEGFALPRDSGDPEVGPEP